jgi:hypothetical protein
VVRYEDKPTPVQETIADILKNAMAADLDNAEIVKAYKATFSYSYWTWMAALNGHKHAINLFEDALSW